jgi:hypothetical protein
MAAVGADPDNRFIILLSNPTSISIGSEKLDLTGIEIATSLLADYYKLENSACFTPGLTMISYIQYYEGHAVNGSSGIYSTDRLEEVSKTLNDELDRTQLSIMVDRIKIKPKLDSSVELIQNLKQQYPKCSSPFLYIPLTLIAITLKGYPQSAHANGILIGRNGTVFRIEPQYDPKIGVKIDKNIDSAVVDIANQIGLKDPRFVELNDVCPQAITLDENCIFWTLFIMNEILRNMYKIKDPNDVIKLYVSKPKPELDALIKNFKTELITKIIPGALANRKISWPDFEAFRKQYPEYVGGKNGFKKSQKNNRIKNGRKSKQNRRRRTRRKGNSQASNIRRSSKFTS